MRIWRARREAFPIRSLVNERAMPDTRLALYMHVDCIAGSIAARAEIPRISTEKIVQVCALRRHFARGCSLDGCIGLSLPCDRAARLASCTTRGVHEFAD